MQRAPPAGFSNVTDRPISTGREPPQPQDWLSVQNIVRDLYVVQKLPLKDVRRMLERDYGFRNASERMFKSRLKAWGYLKNAKKDDWGALEVLHARRKKSGKRNTVFTVRGRERTVKELHKYIRSLHLTEEDFLASIKDHDNIPPHIRADTPDVGAEVKASPKTSEEDCTTTDGPESIWDDSSPQSSIHRCQFSSVFSDRSLLIATTMSESVSQSLTAQCFIASSSDSDFACDQLQRDIEAIGDQIISPAPLQTRYGSEDIGAFELVNLHTPESSNSGSPDVEFLCSRCNQPLSLHFASLDRLAPQDPASRSARSLLNPIESTSSSTSASASWELPTSTRQHDRAWKWSALCFLACIALFRDDRDASNKILIEAADEFEKMLDSEDPMLLTVAQVVASILSMHDQGNIARKIMEAILEVCEQRLPEGDPVRTMIGLWTATARLGGLDESDITSDMLKDVNDHFYSSLGQWHPYTIAASYGYGWTLKYKGKDEEAEPVLRETYRVSCTAFGPRHMQSIFALAATAGAQVRQNKLEEAVLNFKTVIADAGFVLGKSHPYTLEGKRRLATLIKNKEEADGAEIPNRQVEQLYWEVLAGRVKILGRSHEYTRAMRIDYEELCKDRGVWEDREKSVLNLFRENTSTSRMRRSPSPTLSDTTIHAAY